MMFMILMATGMAPNANFSEQVLAALSNKTEAVIVVRHTFPSAFFVHTGRFETSVAFTHSQGCKSGRRSLAAIQIMNQVIRLLMSAIDRLKIKVISIIYWYVGCFVTVSSYPYPCRLPIPL